MKTRQSFRAASALVGVALLIAAGCGGDDDETSTEDESPATTDAPSTTEAANGDVGAYCAASLALETLPEPDYDTASEGDILEWLNTDLTQAVETVAAAAPEEIAEDIAVLVTAVESAAANGEFSAFGGPTFDTAEGNVHAFDLANCGWETVDVEATEYSFGTIPGELESGPVSFEFDNTGAEVHEIVLAKKNPGVTESVAELVQLSDEEAMSKITEVANVYADPGASDYTVAELESGEYIMVCFVPTGMTSTDQEPPPGAAPHYTAGMVAEFTVR